MERRRPRLDRDERGGFICPETRRREEGNSFDSCERGPMVRCVDASLWWRWPSVPCRRQASGSSPRIVGLIPLALRPIRCTGCPRQIILNPRRDDERRSQVLTPAQQHLLDTSDHLGAAVSRGALGGSGQHSVDGAPVSRGQTPARDRIRVSAPFLRTELNASRTRRAGAFSLPVVLSSSRTPSG